MKNRNPRKQHFFAASLASIASAVLVSTTVGIALSSPLRAHAAVSFNPNNILSDSVFRNALSMSAKDIHTFLTAKKSGLAALNVTFNGTAMSIAQLIAHSSQVYKISPKVILTMIQKEQGAIEDSSLSDYQLKLLMGYAPNNSAYEGPSKQIDTAAWQLNRYFERATSYNYKVGKETTTQDGIKVKPDNQATANLFIYNPVAGNNPGASQNEVGNGGNFLFWKLWLRYFAMKYPDGILIQAKGDPGVYLLKNGKRWAFWSRKIFTESYSNTPIVQVSKNDLEAYPIGGPVKFNDGTLIRAKNGGVFVITDGMKKPIPSPRAFKLLGYQGKRIVDVSDLELNIHPQTIKFDEAHLVRQTGALVKIKEQPGVYLIEKGMKRPVWNSYIRVTRFQNVSIIDISKAELDKYPLGRPVEFRDGTIIRDPQKSLFVISKGKRYTIDNASVLRDLNMGSYPIIDVSSSVRNAHPLAGNLSTFSN